MAKITAAEHAQATGLSTSAARRRLEALVIAGKATRSTGWTYPQPSKFSDIRTPPPSKTIFYSVNR